MVTIPVIIWLRAAHAIASHVADSGNHRGVAMIRDDPQGIALLRCHFSA